MNNDKPKVNDKFRYDDGHTGSEPTTLQTIVEVTDNAFRIGDQWMSFDNVECYSHGAGTVNYWRVNTLKLMKCTSIDGKTYLY